MEKEVKLPLTPELVNTLTVGDVLYLTGYVYTCRDAGHKRIQEALAQGKSSPIDWTNQIVYYAGPCPPSPGHIFNSNGPTTAARMDPFLEMMYQLGALATLGKGNRADYVTDLCKKYKRVYLMGVGGASAINRDKVKSAEIIAYEDFII